MLTFREPDGSETENPAEDQVRQRVLDADLTYWEGPAGDASLSLREDARDADLVLIVQAEGALVRYRNFLANDERVAAHPPTGEPEYVEVYDGQEAIMVSRRFLIARQEAWVAASHFLRTGEASPALHWEQQLELQP